MDVALNAIDITVILKLNIFLNYFLAKCNFGNYVEAKLN